jgi:hypothetical protein
MATVKFKCKTKTMTSEFSGDLVEGMSVLLCSVGDKAAREAALAKMQACHERICTSEDQRTAERAA